MDQEAQARFELPQPARRGLDLAAMSAVDHHAPPPPDAESVLGIDNIALDLPIAGVGSRILAAVIDYFIVWIVTLGTIFATVAVTIAGNLGPWWVLAFVVLAIFLIDWCYFIGFEVLGGGRTPGKRAVGLQVVGREGGAASTRGLVVRNLLRHLDLVVGLPLIAADPLGRRVGDRVGDTLVLHDRPAEQDIVLGRLPEGWGSRQVAIVESYLRRAEHLEPHRSRELADRLLALLRRDAPDLMKGLESQSQGDPELVLRRALQAEER